MSVWFAGLLAVLIVFGSLAGIALVFAGAIWIGDAMPRSLRKLVEWFFIVFVAICVFGTLVGLWFIALAWLMGWSL